MRCDWRPRSGSRRISVRMWPPIGAACRRAMPISGPLRPKRRLGLNRTWREGFGSEFPCIIPGCAAGAGPESITTIRSMDCGPAAMRRPGMTMGDRCPFSAILTPSQRPTKTVARGGSTMDVTGAERGRESAHLMLITPERVFYAGLLGRPRQRCSGAFHVYVAIKGGLRLAPEAGPETESELAVVAPYLPHTIASDHRSVICVTMEPETVRVGALDALAAGLAGPERTYFAERIRAAYAELMTK